MSRVSISMQDKYYERCLQLKRRIKRLDLLFNDYVQAGKYHSNYCQRIIDLKTRIRKEISIMLECTIYENEAR